LQEVPAPRYPTDRVTYGNEDDRVIGFLNVALPPDLAYLTPFILAASEPCMLDEDAPSCTMQNGITYPDQ
jgi:hypothetical protein